MVSVTQDLLRNVMSASTHAMNVCRGPVHANTIGCAWEVSACVCVWGGGGETGR
jgi:hypothetical protein